MNEGEVFRWGRFGAILSYVRGDWFVGGFRGVFKCSRMLVWSSVF